jgi:DNA-directed RNA polymerase subunit RPC12/RpoP
MADFKFTCAHCGQEIELDELWTGHQIACPTCQKEITVPPKPDAPPHATLAAAKPGQPKLSIGQGQAARSTVPKGLAPQAVALEQRLAQAKAGQKSSATKWIVPIVVILVLGVGGYLGYSPAHDWWVKRSEAAKQASTNATQQASAVTNAEPAPPAPEKELPVIPPIWTLDVDKAMIPAAKANGMIAGTNFVVETARLDRVGPAYLLRLLQGGTPSSPDRGFNIYLYLNAGESITNHTWTISQDMKGKGVPQVVKLSKTNPRFAAQPKTVYSGYALKLELGDITNGVIPGKIFLAVPPEAEQTVVAGAFKAATSIGDPNAATAVTPVVAPNPAPAVANPAAAERTGAFQKRYGTKR